MKKAKREYKIEKFKSHWVILIKAEGVRLWATT